MSESNSAIRRVLGAGLPGGSLGFRSSGIAQTASKMISWWFCSLPETPLQKPMSRLAKKAATRRLIGRSTPQYFGMERADASSNVIESNLFADEPSEKRRAF
jgi:hypothetical protein